MLISAKTRLLGMVKWQVKAIVKNQVQRSSVTLTTKTENCSQTRTL